VKSQRLKQRIVVTLAAACHEFGAANKSFAYYAKTIWGRSLKDGAKLGRMWLRCFCLNGFVDKDAERSGRPSGAHLLDQGIADAAARALALGVLVHGQREPFRSLAEAYLVPAVRAAFDALEPHGIFRPETVLHAINTVAGRRFALYHVRQTRALTHAQQLTRQLRAEHNLAKHMGNLLRIVQIDSKKIFLLDLLSTTTFLCEPTNPILARGVHTDARLNAPMQAAINYYIGVNACVGVLCVVFVSGTTGLATGYEVSACDSRASRGCARACCRVRPWPGGPAR
jgi:hypothetical protein